MYYVPVFMIITLLHNHNNSFAENVYVFKCCVIFLYLFQAIEQLNIKASFWRDLITDEPFTRKDIIEIQDPSNLDKFNLAKFYHVIKNLKVKDKGIYLIFNNHLSN